MIKADINKRIKSIFERIQKRLTFPIVVNSKNQAEKMRETDHSGVIIIDDIESDDVQDESPNYVTGYYADHPISDSYDVQVTHKND